MSSYVGQTYLGQTHTSAQFCLLHQVHHFCSCNSRDLTTKKAWRTRAGGRPSLRPPPPWINAPPKSVKSLSCLPYFHILCCSKSGTTDMYRRISMHPDIVPNFGMFGKERLYWGWAMYGEWSPECLQSVVMLWFVCLSPLTKFSP